MNWIVWAVLAIALIAAMSAGLALGLHLLKPGWSANRRALVAAGIAAFLPGSLAFGGFFSDGPTGDEALLGFIALLVAQLAIFSICALPPAWWTSARLAGRGAAPLLPADDAPRPIEG